MQTQKFPKKVTLKILANDILNNDYFDTKSCPITKALHRAGLTDYEDSGNILNRVTNRTVINSNNKTYNKLLSKLFDMYHYKTGQTYKSISGKSKPVKPRNFQITLIQ